MSNSINKKRFIIKIILTLSVVALLVSGGVGYLWRQCDTLLENAEKNDDLESLSQADSLFRGLLKHIGYNPEVTEKIIRVSYENKKLSNALDYIDYALTHDPDNGQIYNILGKIHLLRRKEDDSIAAFQKAVELNPRLYESRRNLAALIYARGQQQQAIELLEEVTLKGPGDPEAFNQLYVFYKDQKREDEAEALLEKALELKKPPREVFINLLVIYEKENQEEKIHRLLDGLIAAYPDEPNIYQATSGYYMEKKNPERAMGILEKGMEENPENVDIHILAADFYRSRKQYDKSLDIINRMLMVEPNSEMLYFMLGVTCYEMGQWEQAEKELLRSLSIRRKSPVTLNMLAWLYATAPRDSPFYKPFASLQYARKAVALAPHSEPFIDTLARAMFANGQYEKSITLYKSNIDKEQYKKHSYYGWAVCLFNTGRSRKGAEKLNKALDMGFDDLNLFRIDQDIPEIKNNPRIMRKLTDSRNNPLKY